MQNGEKLLADPCRRVRIGIAAIQENGLLQAIEVRRAVRTVFQMILDRSSASPGNLALELFFKFSRDRFAGVAMPVMSYHDQKSEGSDNGPSPDCPPQPQNESAANQLSYFPSVTGVFVDSLNGRYKGQNPIALVSKKTTANDPRMIAASPKIWSVKYSAAMMTAASVRRTWSTPPMFFFIASSMCLLIKIGASHRRMLGVGKGFRGVSFRRISA